MPFFVPPAMNEFTGNKIESNNSEVAQAPQKPLFAPPVQNVFGGVTVESKASIILATNA